MMVNYYLLLKSSQFFFRCKRHCSQDNASTWEYVYCTHARAQFFSFYNHFVAYWPFVFIHLANVDDGYVVHVEAVVQHRWTKSNSSTANLIDFNEMSWRKWVAAISGVFRNYEFDGIFLQFCFVRYISGNAIDHYVIYSGHRSFNLIGAIFKTIGQSIASKINAG